MLKLLDKLSYPPLIIVAILLAGAPFHPQPHLFEKIQWLANGTFFEGRTTAKILTHSFDLLMHSSVLLVLLAKGLRDLIRKLKKQPS